MHKVNKYLTKFVPKTCRLKAGQERWWEAGASRRGGDSAMASLANSHVKTFRKSVESFELERQMARPLGMWWKVTAVNSICS